jgi:hypothetical protein
MQIVTSTGETKPSQGGVAKPVTQIGKPRAAETENGRQRGIEEGLKGEQG